MVEYLVKKAYWNDARLPIQGLSSIVFHGPSPTWCLASGMIWFDHPDVLKVRCIPMSIIKHIHEEDHDHDHDHPIIQRNHSIFDWSYFESQGKKMCLRFSQPAFEQLSIIRHYNSIVEPNIHLYDPDF